MKFTTSAKKLAALVTMAATAIEKKTTIPILAGIKFLADESTVEMTATDLETAIITTFDAGEVAAGSVVVSAVQLAQALKGAFGNVTLSYDGTAVTLEAGETAIKLDHWPALDYPDMPRNFVEMYDVDAQKFRSAAARALPAISGESSRYTLNGAMIETSADGITIISTDEHRLHMIPVTNQRGHDSKSLVRKSTLAALVKVLAQCNTSALTVSKDIAHYEFRASETRVIGRMMDGNFPEWRRVLPTLEHKTMARIDREGLLKLAKKAVPFADKRSQKLSFWLNGKLKISVGNFEGSVQATGWDHEPVQVNLHAPYVIEALTVSSESDSMHLALSADPLKAKVDAVDIVDGLGGRYVIMPMSD